MSETLSPTGQDIFPKRTSHSTPITPSPSCCNRASSLSPPCRWEQRKTKSPPSTWAWLYVSVTPLCGDSWLDSAILLIVTIPVPNHAKLPCLGLLWSGTHSLCLFTLCAIFYLKGWKLSRMSELLRQKCNRFCISCAVNHFATLQISHLTP